MLTRKGIAEFLYAVCPAETVKDAISRFTPEPIAPFEHVIRVTPERFGAVARYYMAYLGDRVVPIAPQRQVNVEVMGPIIGILGCQIGQWAPASIDSRQPAFHKSNDG
jgi:hypothetical protein